MPRKETTAEKNRRQLVAAEQRQEKVAALYLQGGRVHHIAKTLGISDRTVLRDLDRVRQSWRETAGRTYDDLLPEKLEEIAEVKRQAWHGWKESLKDEEGLIEETNSEGGRTIKKRRGQSGNPQYLNTIAKLLETELRLRGMLDPKDESQQAVPVVEVIVTNRKEKDEFETLTTQQFRRIAETSG